jgi:hypothetical protein
VRHRRVTTKREPIGRPKSIGLRVRWRGLGGLSWSCTGGASTDFRLRTVLAEEEEAPPASGEFCVPPGFGGFKDPGTVFSVLGVEGLSAFGDSPLAFSVEESGWISLGALHKDSSVKNRK